MVFGAHILFNRLMGLMVVLTLVSAFSAPLAAQDEPDEEPTRSARKSDGEYDRVTWTLRGFVVGVEGEDGDSPWHDHDEFDHPFRHRHRNGEYDGGGIGISGEVRFSRRIGLEITGILATDRDWDDWDHHWHDHDHDHDHDHHHDDGMAAVLVGANFHVVTGRRFNLHVGPLVGVIGREGYDHRHDRHDHDHDHGIPKDFLHDYDHDHRHYDHDDWEGASVIGVNIGMDLKFGRNRDWSFYASVKSLSTLHESDHFEDGDWDVASMGFGYRF
ncbi:hypothetical protein SCOR_31825 [Sulfidibacter corallicola]|uniref:Outer membrane protein beta-barrel domain-containing protein n=1 Tax=Sulfidibacter corallicola TaxID=2818388 RepID=A0A8A4TLV6_SULCO|nr:hypothetical protein [Sulfidibacter corallicola]QTD49861.1 hypothetical protein J3U87_30125 [Sulfidibacter corallicola]